MRLTTIILLALCAAALGDDKDVKARAELAGVWQGFAVEGKGENPDRGPVQLELTITPESIAGIQIKGDQRIDHGQGAFTLDLIADPHVLDATKTGARKQAYVGIYTLEGDTLKWCVSPQKTRPTTFETKKGQFLLILKREKK